MKSKLKGNKKIYYKLIAIEDKSLNPYDIEGSIVPSSGPVTGTLHEVESLVA